MVQMKHAYGTVDFYAEQFGDILADVDSVEPSYGANIVKGFYKAIDEWLDYHKDQTEAYAELRRIVQETAINGWA